VNPVQVKTWGDVEAWLVSKGFTKTQERGEGGYFWRSKSKRHIVVPDDVDGYYPDYFWHDLHRRVMDIVP
jgi:hypothetical protein